MPLSTTGRKRLTEQDYWDVIHLAGRASRPRGQQTQQAVESPPVGRRLKSRIKRVPGTGLLERLGSYEDFLLWDVILPSISPRWIRISSRCSAAIPARSTFTCSTRPATRYALPLAVCKKVQWRLNLGAESSWFSPCLIYVGIKR